MPIAVRCPNKQCRRLVRVSSSLRGRRIQCPACGSGLRIPEGPPTEPQPVALDDTPSELAAIRPPAGRSSAEHVSDQTVTATVADRAASLTTSLAPIVKLLLALTVLAGLVFV